MFLVTCQSKTCLFPPTTLSLAGAHSRPPDLYSDPLYLSLNVPIIFLKLAAVHSFLPALLIIPPSSQYLNPGVCILSFNFIHNSAPKPDSPDYYPSLLHNHKKIKTVWTSLMVQWLRIRLPIQGTRVRSLVREDPTCRGATKHASHNY